MAVRMPCTIWSAQRVAYREAWELKHKQVLQFAAGEALTTVFFLEHHPVVTIRRGGHEEQRSR